MEIRQNCASSPLIPVMYLPIAEPSLFRSAVALVVNISICVRPDLQAGLDPDVSFFAWVWIRIRNEFV